MLLSSPGLNILALVMPAVILQVYDRIIPNQAAVELEHPADSAKKQLPATVSFLYSFPE